MRRAFLLKPIVDWFLKLKLRTKFIVSFLLLVLFPFTAFGVVTFQTSEKTIRNNVSSMALKNVTRISTGIDYYLSDIEAVTNIMFNNQDLLSYYRKLSGLPISDSQSEYQSLAAANASYKIIPDIISQRQEKLLGIFFIDRANVFFFHPYYSYYLTKNNFKNQPWYEEALNSKDGSPILSVSNSLFGNLSSPLKVLSITRAVQDIKWGDKLGVLRVDVDYENFSKMVDMANDTSFQKSTLLVLDKNNSLIYENNSQYESRGLEFIKTLKMDSGTAIDTINGSEMYLSYYSSPNTSWKVVNIIPASEVLKDLTFIKYLTFVATIVCILIIVFFSSLVAATLLKPIFVLTEAMAKVENGDLTARVELSSQDETRFLAESFNKMTVNIESLVTMVSNAELKQREAELKQREAQLQSLQSQINPHFLYNTLESIRGVALTNKIGSIASMSESLSQLFSYSISRESMVSLQEEINHLQNYISIQNFRHDDKFDVIYDIPGELYGYSILKLTLQPVVENSVKHGLEMELGKGIIKISISKSDNIMRIVVFDNGRGISKEKLSELNNALSNGSQYTESGTGGIGIQNVNSRLKLNFGEEYGLRFIESFEGTTVEMVYPAIKAEEFGL